MEVILWVVAILELMAYIYIPCACLYGIVRLLTSESVEQTLTNPFFGIKKVSLKAGCLVWGVQALYLGGILCMMYECHQNGSKPMVFSMIGTLY